MHIHTLDLRFLGIEGAIAAFLVEAEGDLILIEAGPHSTWKQLQQGIAHAGFRMEDIQAVLVTHIHLDHAGAAWALAQMGTPVYMHPLGATHMIDPSKLLQSAQRIYGQQMEALWGQLQPIAPEHVHTVEHGQNLGFGRLSVRAWHTPGHAIHHVAWQVGEHLFAGDVAGVRIGSSLVVPPCPPPDIDLQAWDESIELIRRQAPQKLHLTHFGSYTDVEAHLQELQERLWRWAAWVRPYAEAEASPGAITADFQQFIKKDFEAAGVSSQQFDRYEAANPSFMSVSGLLRYWKKHFEKQQAQR